MIIKGKCLKTILVLLVIIGTMLMVCSCGKKEELETTPSQSLDELISIGSDTENGECPEGYVYDYQVSMEPIPEDIAALGGEVCGTVHAYPSRIKIALAKQEIENDEELKRQNEKNVEEIQRYLIDTYGGKFEVKPVRIKYEYWCKEISTENQFTIYIDPLFVSGSSNTAVNLDTYFYKKNAETYNKKLENILTQEVKEDFAFSTFLESGNTIGDDVLDLYVAIFSENRPDFYSEQVKIVKIYSAMKEIQSEENTEMKLRLVITYFPDEYEEIVKKQYNSQYQDDFSYVIGNSVDKLIEEKEVFAQFEYSQVAAWNEEYNLDNVIDEELEVKQSILPYWKGIK